MIVREEENFLHKIRNHAIALFFRSEFFFRLKTIYDGRSIKSTLEALQRVFVLSSRGNDNINKNISTVCVYEWKF